MRAIWSGEISFGLVGVPVKLYSATRSHDVSFHQVHDDDGGRIRYERRCDVCNRIIDYEHIDKAYDDGDKTVILTDEELDALPAEDNDEVEVVQFVPGEQIDPIVLGTAYFLEPVAKSPKSYLLLRSTLVDSELTAVVRFTLRSKTHLGVLRAHGKLLLLQTLRWPEDVREVDFPAVNSRAKVTDKEKTMAAALVDQFAGDFHPEEFTDEYQEELLELIDDKLEQGDALDTAATFGRKPEGDDKKGGSGSGGTVLSLMDALEGSLAKRGGAGTKKSESSAGASGSAGKRSGTTKKTASTKRSASSKSSASSKKTAGTSSTTSKKTRRKKSA